MNSYFYSSLTFIRQRALSVVFSFLFGLSLGYFIKDIFLWRRKEEGYFLELIKEINYVRNNIDKLNKKIKKNNSQNKITESNKNNNAILESFDLDTFQDAQSSLDGIESFYSFNEEMSEDCECFIKELDTMLLEPVSDNYEKCYQLCDLNSWKYQDFSEFLWRYAMISYRTTLIQEFDNQTKIERIMSAFESALNSVRKQPKLSEAHKWLAILYGVTGLLADNKKKILNGYKFKEHIDKSLELNSEDSYAYLLKGRFCFQVSNLAFYERKLASLLFQTPPTSTFEEALLCFQKCEQLCPNTFAENHYYMSQCLKSLGDYAQSAKWLDSAKRIPLKDYESEIKMILKSA